MNDVLQNHIDTLQLDNYGTVIQENFLLLRWKSNVTKSVSWWFRKRIMNNKIQKVVPEIIVEKMIIENSPEIRS